VNALLPLVLVSFYAVDAKILTVHQSLIDKNKAIDVLVSRMFL